MKFEEKFIGFVDILGFSRLVEESESGRGISLLELMDTISKLGSQKDLDRFNNGPTICPKSKYFESNLDFKLTQISDCVIVSSELSPAGIINLVGHCWGAVIELLMKGLMCRGYITKGKIYHSNSQVLGTGYQRAYANESNVTAFKQEADERGTPFVEIDPIVSEYVETCSDDCVREMYSRMVKTTDGTSALFPFKQISHSFMITGFDGNFDPQKEKQSNEKIRDILKRLQERVLLYVDPADHSAMKKAKHYINAIEDQLAICDKTDETINLLLSYYPAGTYIS